MIKSIIAQNLKGLSFITPLHPVTLIYGKNGTGKSARLQTLTLALAGFLPDVGKMTRDLYRLLATGSPMVAAIEADEFKISRAYSMERNDKVSCKVSAIGVEEDFAVSPVSVDAGDYFAKSEAERVKFIFSRINSDLPLESLRATILANVKNIWLDENTEHTEAAILDAVKDLNEYFDDAERNEVVINEVVELIVSDFKEKLSQANANVKRLDSGVQSLTQVADDVAVDPQIEAKIAGAKADLTMLNQDCGGKRQRVQEVRANLTKARNAALALPNEQSILSQIESKGRDKTAAEAMAQPTAFDPAAFVASETTKAQQAELSRRKTILFTEKQNLHKPENIAELRNVNEEIRGRLQNAMRDNDRQKQKTLAVEAQLSESGISTTCTHCGQSIIEQQKAIRERLFCELEKEKALLVISARNESNIAEKSKAHQEQFSIAESALAAFNKNEADYRALENETLTLNAQIERSARLSYDTENNAYLNAQRMANRIGDEIAALRAKLEDKTGATAAAQIPQLEADLQAAEAALNAAENSVATQKALLIGFEQKGALLMRQRAEAATRQTMIDDAAKAKVKASVLKKVCGLLSELQAMVVSKAIDPLLNRVNEICGSILPHALSYDVANGEIGFKIGNNFATSRTMSGSQQALVFGAISIALSSESEIKILIMDELSDFDRDNKKRLVNHILDLVQKKVILQAVFADTNMDAFTVPDAEGKMILDPAMVAKGFGVVQL